MMRELQHHANTQQPQQPRGTQAEDFTNVNDAESTSTLQDGGSVNTGRPSDIIEQRVSPHNRHSEPDAIIMRSSHIEDENRFSYNSIMETRDPAQRRSLRVMRQLDTPGHFQKAQDIESSINDRGGPGDINETINVFQSDSISQIVIEEQQQLISGRSSQILFNQLPLMNNIGSFEQQRPPIKISNIKDLLSIFSVTFNEENKSFEVNGQQYVMEEREEISQQFNIPIHTMSAFFAQQEIPQPQISLNNFNQNAHRATFGNVIEQMQQMQIMQQSFKPTSGFANLGADRPQAGLPNLDQMLLSRDNSPQSNRNRFNNNSQFFPNFGGGAQISFSRAQSEKESIQTADKEIQVDPWNNDGMSLLNMNTPNMNKSQHSFISSNIHNIPLLNFQKSEINYQDQQITDQEYFAEIQRKLQAEIDREEEMQMIDVRRINHHKNKSTNALPVKFGNAADEGSKTARTIMPIVDNHHNAKSGIYTIQASNHLLEGVQQPNLRRIASLGGPSNHHMKSDIQTKLTNLQSDYAKLKEENLKFTEQMSKVYTCGAIRNLSDVQLHLVFLFATPLVVRKAQIKQNDFKSQFKVQPLLEFKREYHEIKNSLKETKRNIKVRSLQATLDNLTMILAQNPLALHFTGHGIEIKMGAKNQHSLLLEQQDGEAEEVSEQQLVHIIHQSNADLEFVFVATCHSEFAGRIFHNAGARHVICVKQAYEIADQAVVMFSKSFYHSVFCQNMTICASFEMAKKQVEIRYGPDESGKFSILTRKETFGLQDVKTPIPKPKPKKKRLRGMPDIDEDDEFNISLPEMKHTCKVFGPFQVGEVETQDYDPKFKEFPSSVENFIGRQIELFEVVHNVTKHRLVNIIGFPGIGKTALAKNAVNYMAD